MPHVLGVATLQLGHPVARIVLVKSDDTPRGRARGSQGAHGERAIIVSSRAGSMMQSVSAWLTINGARLRPPHT